MAQAMPHEAKLMNTSHPPPAAPLSIADLRSPDLMALQREAMAKDHARLHAHLDEFVAVPCPACCRTEATRVFEKYRCQFLRCSDCETLYMSPRPTPALMDDYYSHSENYRLWAERIFPTSEANRREKLCRPMLDSIVDACRRHGVPTGHLVELGPGFGTFAELAKDSGDFGRVSVVERTPEMAASCRQRGLEVHECAAEDLPAGNSDMADVLVCFEVIEHVFDPAAFLAAASRLLRSGGLLVMTCPNGQGFDTATLGAASVAVDTEHVNLFNPRSMARLLSGCGYEVLDLTTPGRLDVELVREAALQGSFEVNDQPFLHRVLIDEYERLGPALQRFLADQGLSGSMRVIARKA
jgi:SAM-dependent methyltransferase